LQVDLSWEGIFINRFIELKTKQMSHVFKEALLHKTNRYLSACPGATQLNTLLTLQFNEAVAIKLTPLRARTGPGFEAEFHYIN